MHVNSSITLSDKDGYHVNTTIYFFPKYRLMSYVVKK